VYNAAILKIDNTTRKDLTEIGTLDFQSSSNLFAGYALRAAGLVIFAALFVVIARAAHPDLPLAADTFIGIAIEGAAVWVSILFLIFAVAGVLYLHELIHAAAFFAFCGAPPKIGAKRWLIFAAAPGYLNRRGTMAANALAPFVVISLVGAALLVFLPTAHLSWVFVPTVVNAAAAGGDFLAVAWLGKLPEGSWLEDDGERLTAYRLCVGE
jgi:hypothetical protein